MDFDSAKYKAWTWKHPVMLHWILNPGLAVYELVLGQRTPRVILVEKNSNKSLAEKSFVPCPHCHTIHPGLKWSPQNKTAFKNWFGLYCDHCGKTIPCLWNLASLIILAVTFPIWIWFVKGWKKKWLAVQRQKFSKPLDMRIPTFNWVTQGLGWGLMMFVFMVFLFPLLEREEITARTVFIGLVVWTVGGLLFGYVSQRYIFRGSVRKG